MEDNDSMEGKNIELDMFEQKILEAIKIAEKQKTDTAVINNGQYPIEIRIVKEDNKIEIKVFGEQILSLDNENRFNYNLEGLKRVQERLQENQKLDYEQFGLPDIEYLEELQHKKDENQRDENDLSEDMKEKDEEEQSKDEEEPEQDNEEKDDENNEELDDTEKQEIAKIFDVDPKDIVHLDTRNEKITVDENFSELVRWAEGRSNVYVAANKQGSIEKVVEKTKNGYEEIQHNMKQIHGEYPNVNIHLVGNDEIEKIVPLKIYQIDSKHAFATIRNGWGELETIYCTKQEGEEKYWGSKVPELSGKNARQLEYDQRELMSSKYNSGTDLAKKADKFNKVQDLEKRGVPTEPKGVQEDEIGNNSYAKLKNKIVKDLMKREGVIDEQTRPTGYFEHKADKIIKLMDDNKKLQYKEAVEKVEESQQRKPGGMARGEKIEKR